MKATHENRKTGKKIIIDRIEGNIFVVKNMKGKVLESFPKSEMASFNKRYKSLRAKAVKG